MDESKNEMKEKSQGCRFRKEGGVSRYLRFNRRESFMHWFYGWGYENLLLELLASDSVKLQGWSLGDSPQSRNNPIN